MSMTWAGVKGESGSAGKKRKIEMQHIPIVDTVNQINEALKELEEEIQPREGMSSKALRERAKSIASIGVDNFKGELLRSCFSIAMAITTFADELDAPTGWGIRQRGQQKRRIDGLR